MASETVQLERAGAAASGTPVAGTAGGAPEAATAAEVKITALGALPPAGVLDPTDTFVRRHLGPSPEDVAEMLSLLGLSSLAQLVDETVPESIRIARPLTLPGLPDRLFGERELLSWLRDIARQNRVARSFLGMGYNDCIVPGVIQRNVLENPGWYTQYTPYQSEISQGRLEALLNFQTLIEDLTGLPIANASLLDEGTAAAEAMHLCAAANHRSGRSVFFVAADCHPQTIAVVETRAAAIGIEVRVGRPEEIDFAQTGEKGGSDLLGILLQYPTTDGRIVDYAPLVERAHQAGVLVVMAADLLALTLLRSPGEIGADVAVGNTQRFGVPLGYGGPHAAYFATRDEFKRQLPGRIIGVSKDARGKTAYRMAMQTREQHIRREKATSNVCTAQVLLAVMASMYAVYHGPEGLKRIARRVHALTLTLAAGLTRLGYKLGDGPVFDTLRVELPAGHAAADLVEAAVKRDINLRPLGDRAIGISLDEATTSADLTRLLEVFAGGVAAATAVPDVHELAAGIDTGDIEYASPHARSSEFLTHPVFNRYHTEHEMLRYIKRLESRDLSLTTSMIPLGSCTMKLNATTEMQPLSWPEFANLHPFVPADQARGYQTLFDTLEAWLAEITGFAAVSLQPNAGSQGEYAGLLVIRAYQKAQGQGERDVCLIPVSAHGTNPASAVMAGMKVVVVACDERGNVDVADLKAKAEQHKDRLAALMVTYPSTHGVFEAEIREICNVVHANGGQVYMDGANMNAQVGLCRPGDFGADVCHLNLHKTFCIPHGGGGPGMGPIACAAHLAPFLPGHPVVATGGERGDRTGVGGPLGERQHPHHLLDLYRAHERCRADPGERGGDLECQLHGGPARPALPHPLLRGARPGGARVHPRSTPLEGRWRRGGGRGEEAHRLRLPRPDDVLPRRWDADDRAHRERVQGGARPPGRCSHRHPGGDPGDRGGADGQARQSAQTRPPHRRRGHRDRVEPPLQPRAGGLPRPLGAGEQVLAQRRAGRQRLGRQKPALLLPADERL